MLPPGRYLVTEAFEYTGAPFASSTLCRIQDFVGTYATPKVRVVEPVFTVGAGTITGALDLSGAPGPVVLSVVCDNGGSVTHRSFTAIRVAYTH